ncbi:hypothetical protein HDE_02395 [Halotydeus destructor]|nr:hypothetical protein HDE_02395 [Halotydeus destructor]
MGNYLPFAALESTVPRSHRVANDVYSHRLNRSTSADIRNSSASLLSLIKRTTKMLKAEAAQLESLGKYDFDSLTTGSILDIGLAALDTDDQAIKKLTLVRNDVREKLKNVSDVIKQNNIEVNK